MLTHTLVPPTSLTAKSMYIRYLAINCYLATPIIKVIKGTLNYIIHFYHWSAIDFQFFLEVLDNLYMQSLNISTIHNLGCIFLFSVIMLGMSQQNPGFHHEFVRNHSFVFISGWPQSGTSFVHQIFTLSQEMSTMVEKCESLLGKRCVNWNHEGQWLIPGSTRNILNSGAMCPHNGNLTKLERMSLLSEVSFWYATR